MLRDQVYCPSTWKLREKLCLRVERIAMDHGHGVQVLFIDEVVAGTALEAYCSDEVVRELDLGIKRVVVDGRGLLIVVERSDGDGDLGWDVQAIEGRDGIGIERIAERRIDVRGNVIHNRRAERRRRPKAQRGGHIRIPRTEDGNLVFFIVDAEASAENDLPVEVIRVPRKAELGAEISLLGGRKSASLNHVQAGKEGGASAGSDDGEIVLLVRHRPEVVPAKARVDREGGSDFEVVLEENSGDVLAVVLSDKARHDRERVEGSGFGNRSVVEEVPEALEGERRMRIRYRLIQELDMA